MATTKESVNVITEGIGMEDTRNEVEEFAEAAAGILADLAADRFLRMLKDREEEIISGMAATLSEVWKGLSAENAVIVLQRIFRTFGKDLDAEDLDVLGVCAMYDELVFDYFMDAFLGSEEISFFLPEIRYS